jgi:DNA polymerase III subunit delta'
MAEETDDPREVAWHPRFASAVQGHADAFGLFRSALASGKPHHAWLITGPFGIGKATLAYKMAEHALALSMASPQVERWVRARAHPDFSVLERSLNDSKPRKLRAEISVEDGRRFIDFFSRTSSGGGWRVGLVDAADDLNTESANALLKLVEEPPAKTLILLVCHAPGKLLRTLKSRCRRLPVKPLTQDATVDILSSLPIEPAISAGELQHVAEISGGSPGFALQLSRSEGAKAFQVLRAAKRLDAATRNSIGQHFSARAAAQQDFLVFMDLLLEWLAAKARKTENAELAALHAALAANGNVVDGYNLDRRVAVMDTLAQIDLALKAA